MYLLRMKWFKVSCPEKVPHILLTIFTVPASSIDKTRMLNTSAYCYNY